MREWLESLEELRKEGYKLSHKLPNEIRSQVMGVLSTAGDLKRLADDIEFQLDSMNVGE